MPNPLPTGAVHHLTLTVTDINRSREFYTNVLGFQVVTEIPAVPGDPGPRLLLSNGNAVIALRPSPYSAPRGDRFDEGRVGLDHLSFLVGSRSDLDDAARILDQQGIPRGEIEDLGELGMWVLPFRDPDNIQLELTALK